MTALVDLAAEMVRAYAMCAGRTAPPPARAAGGHKGRT